MRKTVYEILKKHEDNNTFVNLDLKNKHHDQMAKITLRVYGYLENYLYLDYLLAQSLKDNPFKLNSKSKLLLKLAIHELLFLQTKDYVVISEYQNLAKTVNQKQAPFISFYLHNLLPTKLTTPHFSNEEKNLSIKYSLPRFLIKELIRDYPDNYMDIFERPEKNNFVRKRANLLSPQDFHAYREDSEILKCLTNPVKSADFIHHNVVIQDLGAILVGRMVGPKTGEKILDMCAAPGNKTLQLLDSGAEVVANEINPTRSKLLTKNVVCFGYAPKILNLDGTDNQTLEDNLNGMKFDKILIDAPCSGSGTIFSKPDIRPRITQERVTNLIATQRALLQTADKLLKPGGAIIYSTCSILHQENEENIKWFLQNYNYKVVQEPQIATFCDFDGYGYPLLPYQHGSDGFFMTKLVKE